MNLRIKKTFKEKEVLDYNLFSIMEWNIIVIISFRLI